MLFRSPLAVSIREGATPVYTWNKEYVEKLLNLIMILVQEIPVYRLINRADHDSVEIVKKELQKEVI